MTKGTALAELGRAIEGLGLIATGQTLAESNGFDATTLRAAGNRLSVDVMRDPRTAVVNARAAIALARRLGTRSPLGVVLGNGVQAAVRAGEWRWASEELEATLTEDFEGNDRFNLLAATTILRALRGDPVADLMAEIVSLVGSSVEPAVLSELMFATANEAFAAGRLGDARGAWHRCGELRAGSEPTTSACAARAALWLGDVPAATNDLAVLDASGVHGPAIEADRRTIRAGIMALEGRASDALPLYREALRAWRDLGLAWDEALCGIDMATLLDPSNADVRDAAESSREILVRLEARPFIARLNAVLARPTAAHPSVGRREATAETTING